MQFNSRLTFPFAAGLALMCSAAFAHEPQSKPPGQQSADPAQHEDHARRADMRTAQGSKSSEGSMAIHDAMMKSMDMRKMPMTGNPDQDFATMMIHHHQQAIAMSQAQLKHGTDPQVRRTAQRIIDDSKKDIAELEKWRKQAVASADTSKEPSSSRY